MKKIFNLIFPICAGIWVWYFSQLMFNDDFQLSWFSQVVASWVCAISFVTHWIDSVDK